jgi:phage shock protein PspC (stress-responsive transcriptional regulator)
MDEGRKKTRVFSGIKKRFGAALVYQNLGFILACVLAMISMTVVLYCINCIVILLAI